MARGRKKKTVLNQKLEEPKNDVKVTVTEEMVKDMKELHGVDIVEEIKTVLDEEKTKVVEEPKGTVGRPDSEMISLKDSGEKLSEVLQKKEEVVTEPEEEEVVEKVDETPRPAGIRSLSKEQRNSLSRRELRYFQRTGILPK